ncbi:HlyD family efflux transporter periplasmic adaptor subunit [Variovorax sp. 375MFSha3.1]|uniref:efflux RND transporter periplasmic adaptor subunit n=1 Tax=Variovorax sp. 375MFSha3.1 TaxID=3158364 RepID=UPI003AAD7B83
MAKAREEHASRAGSAAPETAEEAGGHASLDSENPAIDSAPGSPDNKLLLSALEGWRARLSNAGVTCGAAAMHSADAAWSLPFSDSDGELNKSWADLRMRVSMEHPVALAKVGSVRSEMLVATAVQLPSGHMGVVGLTMAPPHSERTIQLVLLSLGWLQLALSAASLAHNQRSARLLELMGHVGSQESARAAAYEWINRTAAWVRAEAPELDAGFMLFEVRNNLPSWWVAADTSWAEKASPALHEASEMAMRAMVEMQEIDQHPWWALPLLGNGEPVAVLVVRHREAGAAALQPDVLAMLRASSGLAEPLLRHWREAQRSLLRHVADTARSGWRKVWGPGHLTWKAGTAALCGVLAILLLWPVADRVTAHTVIEGRTRQVVTAPFEGFIEHVQVRPGEQVSKGQLLARLDDRELKLEQRRYSSERNQAAGKLRQAMAEHDAPAVALAQADVQQAEAQLALVESKLLRAGLVAPMDGLVVTGDWAQQIGGPVEIGKEMFEIATTGGYRVVLHVPDRDIARVKVGQNGILRLTGQPHATYDFEVKRVTATAKVEEGVNGFRVEAEWRGDVPALSPGMQGVGKVEVGKASLLSAWTRSSVDWLRLKLWSWWW